ncbi:MAG: glycosyltransferase family 2 protein [Phycisphaeraceae bacterium]|nr:MAG: glycosyltransferase family 2 protein [Phycisphaeraceae bacterium]
MALEPRPHPTLLSVVIPCYNEEAVLPLLRERLIAFFEALPGRAEAVFVNDGSRDRTLEMLLAWSRDDPRIKVVSLASNFGHQIAVTAGLDYAAGDAVVIMDADLQDPPEVVLQMIDRYCAGYDVVYGKRVERAGESGFKLFTAWVFYRLMRRLVHRDLPADAGDFRLVSRRALDAIRAMREQHRFLRGMFAWIGFPQTAVEYKRAERAAGETKYPLRKMLRLALIAALSFGPSPLRLVFVIAALVALFAVGYTAYTVLLPLMGVAAVPGWSSQIVLTCLIGASVLFGIGMVGEYVARIYEEVKGRPLYLVARSANIEAGVLPPGPADKPQASTEIENKPRGPRPPPETPGARRFTDYREGVV